MRRPKPSYLPCVVRELPEPALAFGHPDRLAVLKAKYWGPKVDLGVTFLDGADVATKAKVLLYANKWGEYGNIRFRESADGEIRIAREKDGYWSYLGKDILGIPKGKATMNLEGFTSRTPDREYDRVVCHEFGHTLGFPHEHERAEIIALLDVEKTVAYFQRHGGWDRKTTMEQVFGVLDPKTIEATGVDLRSIMTYSFPGECTKSGEPIPGGDRINDIDAKAVAKLYPKGDAPPPPTGTLPAAKVPVGVRVGGVQVSAEASFAAGSKVGVVTGSASRTE